MAKGVGLDAGEFEVKVVELDGSYRKPRLTKISIDRVAQRSHAAGDEAHAVREAASAVHALRDAGVAKENVTLGFPCREAVLRTLTVPFKGNENIRKMIKFEAEGEIHSHSVDDMVIDFHTFEETEAGSRVLVAAVPKGPLRTTLRAFEQAGLEPEVVDLDTMALLRVAEWCGAFTAGELPVEAPATDAVAVIEQLPASAAGRHVVLDLGARSTRVLIVANQRLVDMRALRVGSDAIAEDVASAAGVDLDTAREAVIKCLQTGQDHVVAPVADAGDDSEAIVPVADADVAVEDDLFVMTDAADVVSHLTVAQARDRFLERLQRELVRFLAGVSTGSIDRVWATGGGSVLPGVPELLGQVFGVEPQPLDVLGRLSHNLDPEEAYGIAPRIAVAVGLALGRMGGVKGFNFRQEDLSFTKGFDRVKFPLAVACMLGLFLVVVFAMKTRKEGRRLELEYGRVFKDEMPEKGGRRDTVFYGHVGQQMNVNGWFAMDRYFPRQEFTKLQGELVETPVFDRLPKLYNTLDKYFKEKQNSSGYYPELRVGSGVGVLSHAAGVLQKIESQLGRYVILKIDLRMPKADNGRFLSFEIALRADQGGSFRTKYSALRAAFEADCGLPESPFFELHDKVAPERPFESEAGNGAIYTMRMNLKPEEKFPVFPPAPQPVKQS